MSLKLRHHLGVPGSLDGVRIPNCAVERKYLWIRLRGQVGPADLLSRVLSRKRLRCPRCCAHLASFPVHHYNHQQLDTANHLLQSPVFVSSCKDSHLCMHTHKRKLPRWYTQQGISGFWKKAQAVGCSYCEPGVLHLYLPATANLYSLTVGCTSFLWGELSLWCVVVAVVLRGIFQDCYSVSQWLWAVYFGGSGRKFNHSSVMSFQNQRSTHSALSSTECSYRHALCSRPSIAQRSHAASVRVRSQKATAVNQQVGVLELPPIKLCIFRWLRAAESDFILNPPWIKPQLPSAGQLERWDTVRRSGWVIYRFYTTTSI